MIHRTLGVEVTWDRPQKKRKRKLPVESRPVQVEPKRTSPLTWDIELSRDSGKVKQSRRASRRQTVRQQQPQQTLRKASVGPQTLKKYEALWNQLVSWSGNVVTVDMDKRTMDKHLTAFLEHLYLEGEDLSKANYVTAAVIFHVPGTKGLSSLPLAQQSMKGWRRLCPPRARMPIPFEAVCLLCQAATKKKQMEVALSMMLTFVLYLRPAEVFRLRVQDIVKPVGRKHKTYRHFAILLHPSEVGIPSKTLQYDEMLTLDLSYQQFLGPALVKHLDLNNRMPEELAFSISLQDMTDFMEEQWEGLGLAPLGPIHAYRLRHGGASHEAALSLREMTAIQARGRWQTLRSLKNYAKGGRLQQLVKALSRDVQQKAALAVKQVAQFFR